MKTLIVISVILIGYYSFGQNTDAAVEMNYGVSLKRGDRTDSINTHILNFDNAEVAAFPASYATKIFGRSDQYKTVQFVTVDTELVKTALTELNRQYCNALLKFNKRTWQQTIQIHKEYGLRKDLKKIRRQQKEYFNRHNKYCSQHQADLAFKDKQVVTYRNASGDTILFIQIVDFRQDPYKLKQYFTTTWIDGWHGWFETNTMRFHYHAGKKLITINEDL